MRIWWVLVLIASLACRREQPAARAVTPPTQEEAEAFGKQLVKHLAPCDPVALDHNIDFGFVIARAVAGREISGLQVAQFRKEFDGRQMCEDLKDIKYSFLRTQRIDGAPQVLLRGIADAGGYNYARLELDKRDGRVRVADLYYATTGERASETMRHLIDAMFAKGNAVAIGEKLKRIVDAHRDGDLAEVRAVLASLPADVRATKAVMIRRLQLVAPDDPEYLAALEAFEKAFPNDPGLLIHQIDHALLRKDFDGAVARIAALDAVVGGDPYLDAMRAAIQSDAGNHAEAIAGAKRATVADPTLMSAWMILGKAQVAGKDFTGALATLEVLRDRFDTPTDADTLRSDPRYAALADSAEYAAWSKRQ